MTIKLRKQKQQHRYFLKVLRLFCKDCTYNLEYVQAKWEELNKVLVKIIYKWMDVLMNDKIE